MSLDFEKMGREIVADVSWGDAQSHALDLGLALIQQRIATALKQLHDDTLERAAVVADGYKVGMANPIGALYGAGMAKAGECIAADIRNLKSPDSGGAK